MRTIKKINVLYDLKGSTYNIDSEMDKDLYLISGTCKIRYKQAEQEKIIELKMAGKTVVKKNNIELFDYDDKTKIVIIYF